MPSSAKDAIQQITLDHELHTCPGCGYTDGFHVSLQQGKDNNWNIVLICPQCHQRYQIEWHVNLGT